MLIRRFTRTDMFHNGFEKKKHQKKKTPSRCGQKMERIPELIQRSTTPRKEYNLSTIKRQNNEIKKKKHKGANTKIN